MPKEKAADSTALEVPDDATSEEMERMLNETFQLTGSDETEADGKTRQSKAEEQPAESTLAPPVSAEEVKRKAMGLPAATKPAKETEATAAPVASAPATATIGELLRQNPKAQEFHIGNVVISRKELEDFSADSNWVTRNQRRANEIRVERERLYSVLPLAERVQADPQFAHFLDRAVQLYDNPSEVKPSRPLALSENLDEDLMAENFARSSAPKGEGFDARQAIEKLTYRLNQMDNAKADDYRAAKQAELDLICNQAYTLAQKQGITWTTSVEKRFLDRLEKLGGPNDEWTEDVCQDAYKLATWSEQAARTADEAIAVERRAKPTPPPAIRAGHIPSPKVSAEMLSALTTGPFANVREKLGLTVEELTED